MPHSNPDLLDQENSTQNESDRLINTISLNAELSLGRKTNDLSYKIDNTKCFFRKFMSQTSVIKAVINLLRHYF